MIVPFHEIEPGYHYLTVKGMLVVEKYCFNPICTCEKVDLAFIKDTSKNTVDSFTCQFNLSKIKFENIEIVDKTLNIQSILNDFLNNSELIQRFKANYIKTKLAGMQNSIPDITMPIIMEQLDEGDIHGYCELFPNQELKIVPIKNKEYYLYDTYCVDPDCDCNHVEIYLIQIDQEKLKYQIVVAFDYLFNEEAYKINQKTCSKNQAVELIQELIISTDVIDEFKHRYHIIKELMQGMLLEDEEDEDSNNRDINLFNFDEEEDENDLVDDDDFDFDEEEFNRERLNNLFKNKFKSSKFKTLLTQVDLDTLINSYNILTNEETKMTKQELVSWYCNNYFKHFEKILSQFHREMMDLVFQIVDADGELDAEGIPFFNIVFLELYVLAFPVTKDDTFTLVISDEVFAVLNIIDRHWIYEEIQKNDVIIRYVRKLVHTYGEFDLSLLFNYLEEYENIKLNYDDVFILINNDGLFTNQYDVLNGIISSLMINEIDEFYSNREKYKDLAYYKIPRDSFYEEPNLDELEDLITFLDDLFMEDEYKTMDFVDLLKQLIQYEVDFESILDTVKPIDIDIMEYKQLEKLLLNLINNTRLFSLKGHTRREIKEMTKLIPYKKIK